MYERQERRRRLHSKYSEAKSRRSAMYPNQQQQNAADCIIVGNNGVKYAVVGNLGHGQFGQVYAAIEVTSNLANKPKYAIKVARPGPMYRQQAFREVQILKQLQKLATPDELKYCIHFVDWFNFNDRLCIVNEHLYINLFEVTTTTHQ